MKLFVLSYTGFLCDSPLEEAKPKPEAVIYRFYRRLMKEQLRGPEGIIAKFSGYANILLQSKYVTGVEGSTSPFHPFMHDTPIFKEYHEWLVTGRPDLLAYVLSFLMFGKKLDYADSSLDEAAFRGWIEVEERLRTLQMNPKVLRSLAVILRTILAPIDDSVILPKFGPGKVAERGCNNVFDKLDCLSTDAKLEYAFRAMRRTSDVTRTGHHGSPWLPVTHSYDSGRISLLRFVPKDINKSRSICMEPNGYMYYQQEVLRMMRNGMEQGLMSLFVDMSDQTRNQEAAIHGSLFHGSDTLDLSSASDSVSVDLVRRIFPKDYLYYMLATRTSMVKLPNGGIVSVKKFAPMGSAVCFPTQCCVFTACSLLASIAVSRGITPENLEITEADVRDHIKHRLWRSRHDSSAYSAERYEPPVVFGDDIIVDTRVSDTVISILTNLGFVVNVNKSFTGMQSFRESCGVFACDGQDVTPVIFRIPSFGEVWDTEIYTSFIANINKVNSKSYRRLGSFWLSVVKQLRGLRGRIPFTSDPFGVGVFTKNKHSLRCLFYGPAFGGALRWNAAWQVLEEKQQWIGPRNLGSTKGGIPANLSAYEYDQWWRSNVHGGSHFSFGEALRIRPQETRFVPIWARCEE